MEMDEAEFDELVRNLVEQCPEERQEWLGSKLRNEVSLRKRIKKLIEPFKSHFGKKKKRTKLINKIVSTRNYLIHYDPLLESEAAQDQDLQILCLKIEVIFQLHFLQLIGFSQEEINSIADHQLKRKLQL